MPELPEVETVRRQLEPLVVHHAIRVRAVLVASRGGQPPIHRESRPRLTVRKPGRLEVGQHVADELKKLFLQPGAVVLAGSGILQGHVVRRHATQAELRAAVGVGGVEQQKLRWQLPGRLRAPLEILPQGARHADQIQRDDDEPMPGAVIECQGLGKQILCFPLGRPVP